jgi:hypothetical protein
MPRIGEENAEAEEDAGPGDQDAHRQRAGAARMIVGVGRRQEGRGLSRGGRPVDDILARALGAEGARRAAWERVAAEGGDLPAAPGPAWASMVWPRRIQSGRVSRRTVDLRLGWGIASFGPLRSRPSMVRAAASPQRRTSRVSMSSVMSA